MGVRGKLVAMRLAKEYQRNTQRRTRDEVDPMSSEDVPGGGTRRDQTRMKSELCNQERNETKAKNRRKWEPKTVRFR